MTKYYSSLTAILLVTPGMQCINSSIEIIKQKRRSGYQKYQYKHNGEKTEQRFYNTTSHIKPDP